MESVKSIADLRALSLPTTAACLLLLGYYAPGDGGGGSFYWDASASDPDNGGTIIAPTPNSPVKGRWKRIFSRPLDVKWFGAIGDGTSHPLSQRYPTLAVAQADYPFVTSLSDGIDWAGIQAAFDAVPIGGGMVYVSPGTYMVSTSSAESNLLTLRNGTTVLGCGAASVLRVTTGTVVNYVAVFGAYANNPSGITIRSLWVDQNPTSASYTPNGSMYCLLLIAATDVVIEDCNFNYCGSNAINISGASARAWVLGCTFTFQGAGPTAYDNSTIYLHVADHTIANNVFIGAASLISIANLNQNVPYAAGGIETHLGPSTVTGNLIENYFVGMNVVSADQTDSAGVNDCITISGNTLRGVNYGIKLWAGGAWTLTNVTISGNTIGIAQNEWNAFVTNSKGGNSSCGIALTIQPVYSAGNYEGITITGNMIGYEASMTNATPDGIAFCAGVSLCATGRVSHLLVANNTILYSPCKGIDVSSLEGGCTVTGLRVTGNLIVNPGIDSTAGSLRRGISSEFRALVNCSFDNNQIVYDNFPIGTYYSLYVNPASATNVFVRNNRVTSTAGVAPAYSVTAGLDGVGPSTARPDPSTAIPGETFFDTTKNKIVWWDPDAIPPQWVKSDGSAA